MNTLIKTFERSLISFNRHDAEETIIRAKKNYTPLEILENIVTPALEKIGSDWEKGSVALSQVYLSGIICEKIVDDLLPSHAVERILQPPMAIAVLEDHHLLGMRIVYSVMRSIGYENELPRTKVRGIEINYNRLYL